MEEKKKGRNKNRHCGFFMCHGPLILLIIPRRLYYFHCIVRKWKFKEVKSLMQPEDLRQTLKPLPSAALQPLTVEAEDARA